MIKFKVKEAGFLVDAAVIGIHGISKQKVKNMLKFDAVYINGNQVRANNLTEVSAGDLVEIEKAGSKSTRKLKTELPQKQNVTVLFEDAHIIVGHKPAGIVTSGETSLKSLSYHKMLENFMMQRDKKKTRLWIIHRLDREVEGIIMFAKSERVMERMKNDWENVTKRYLALTEGAPNPAKGHVKSWLKDTQEMKVISSQHEIAGSKWAETLYTTLRKVEPYTLLEIELITGRKNQIRVHLSDIGCPVVGDRKYGADSTINRQIRLMSYYLSFLHPVTNKPLEFKIEASKHFLNPSKAKDEVYK